MAKKTVSRRDFVKATALGGGAIVLGSCAAPLPTTAPASAVKRGGTLIIGTAQQIQFLDPNKGGLRNNYNAFRSIFSTLTTYDKDGVPVPDLAESLTADASDLVWTIKIRSGVKFHNGRDMTADDVKFSLDFALNPDNASVARAFILLIKQVDLVDKQTIKVTLEQPYGLLPAALHQVFIIDKDNLANIATKPNGTGPFSVKEYNTGQNLELVKFSGYWEKGGDGAALPYLDAVSIRTLTDTNALYTSLSTGTVHAFWQMPDQIQIQAKGAANLQLLPSPFKTTHDEWFFQGDVAPFNDVRARQALLYAWDKEAIVQAGYFGQADPRLNNNIIPPGSWAEDTSIPAVKRDPAKAKQLFEAAGVKTIKFLGYTITPQFRPISQVMERNLNEIGVKLELEFMELGAWLALIKAGEVQPWGDGDQGASFGVNISVNPPDPGMSIMNWGCKTHFGSWICFDNLKAAADKANAATSIEERRVGFKAYQEIWAKEVPAIITCHRAFTHAALKTVHGLFDDDGVINFRRGWSES